MTDTYSPRLRLVKQQTATNRLVWGSVLNSGLIDLLDEAIAGSVSIDVSAGNVTLSTENGATDEARAMTIVATGAAGSARAIIVPTLQKVYNVHNNCGQTLTVRTANGSGVAITNGNKATLFVDEILDEVFQPALHRSQTIAPDTSSMDALAGTVTGATGGTMTPTLYSHREGQHVSISCNTINVDVASLVFGISVTLPDPPGEDLSYPIYIREDAAVVKAYMTFFPSSILIIKADGTDWTNPSTRIIPAMTFSYRTDD